MKHIILAIGILVAFVCANDSNSSYDRMLEKQLQGMQKYGKNNPPPQKKQVVPTPRLHPIVERVVEKKWWEEERFKNTISGDRRIDALFDGFGLSVVFDIDRNEKKFDAYCSYGDKSIHMKPIDHYRSNGRYVEALLHELGHCIEGENRSISYKYNSDTKNYQYKVEELIADKYAIKMGKILGYKGIGSYGSNYYVGKNTDKLRWQGAMMGSIDFYVSGQVNSAISKSKAIIGRKKK